MYSDEDLESAVRAGALSAAAAEALRTHVAAQRRSPLTDEEHVRLITGFNDVFVVIACGLLLLALGGIGRSVHAALGGAAVALAAWLLAEYFVRLRRMALPAIVLLLSFVGGVYMTVFASTGAEHAGLAGAAVAAGVAAWLHWRRFKVPLTVAAGAAALVLLGAAALTHPRLDLGTGSLQLLLFLAGCGVLAVALYWDASDTQRLTRRSDVAFWLHLLAAPLLVHPVFMQILPKSSLVSEVALSQVAAILAIYGAIGLLSLALDRRALMVSALGYVIYALNSFLKQTGTVSLSFAVAALLIGAVLLLLSVFWHRCRRTVLDRLPSHWQQRLARQQ